MSNVSMDNIQYYTAEGLERLKNECHTLKTKGRADIAKQIAEATDKGDLSENAEYDAAKEAQGLLELKISKLEKLILNARILNPGQIDNSCVRILSKVRIKYLSNNTELTYQLVSEEEADLNAKKISAQSPIGKSLMGKKVGDIVNIQVPAGDLKVEILEIST